MANYIPVLGIEIHAELKTKTKMFGLSLNDPDETRPNVNIDPVNMAHPGTLPVINKKAIEHMVRIGLAVGGKVANFTEFDRKNYFYPDIPKNYQISQYKYPIVSGGELAGVLLTRIHLEEDTGTSKHDRGNYTLVDYNRAGVPLMELVTEPIIYDVKAGADFARELQLLLRYLGASDANMEKGEMRVEANVSVMKTDKTPAELKELYLKDPETYMSMLGTKVEVKNLNSFKSMERATEYEIQRMIGLIEDGRGDEITQETRGWDENTGRTVSQRKKESASDYRYFPDPDLPKLYLHELFDLEKEKAGLPELPWEKRARLLSYGIKADDVEVFITDDLLMDQFESTLSCLPHPYDTKTGMTLVNIIISDLQAIRKKDPASSLIQSEQLAVLVQQFAQGKISSRIVKDFIPRLVYDRIDVLETLEKENLIQQNDPEALKKIAQQVIDENPTVVTDYKNGNEKVIKFLMGQVMKMSGGSANPQVAENILKELMQ